MAIGDTLNQNPFGTNFNPEDEEEKKARLAAQDVRMGAGSPTVVGAGNIPASAFGQAPAELPIETVPNVSSSDDPSFMSRLASILYPSGSVGGSGGFGLPPTVTPPSAKATQAEEGTDISPITLESLGLESSGQKRLKESLGQPSSNIDPFTGQTIENPTPFSADKRLPAGMDMNQAAIMNALPEQSQGVDMNQAAIINALPKQNQGMDMNQQSIANAQGQEATVPLPAQTLSQFMRYEDSPEQRTEQFVDEQGRMRFRPTQEALQLQGQGAVAQPPVDALSSFEQDSLARQQGIGGTGSFEGDSEAREARVRASDRQPGESQADRDTRIAQSRTTGGQTEGLSFDDARRRAEGQLAARGVKNPSASQVNALARGIQAGEPERLAELETKRAVNEARLKTAQATLDRPEFEGKVYTINGVTFAQTSNGGAQVISTGTETPEEATAKMKDYEFALEQIDKARKAYQAGDIDKANDIFTAAEIQKDGFATNATEYFKDSITPPASKVTDSGLTQQQESGIQNVMATNKITREDAIKALKEAGKLK